MKIFRSFVAVRMALTAGASTLDGSPPADAAQVEALLRSVLNSWKAGRRIDEPAGADHVAEPRWKAGCRLERYEVGSDFEPADFDLSCPVELWMHTPTGKAVREQVHYIVSTTPRRVVIRSPP